jgi:anti-sigma factor RsiW
MTWTCEQTEARLSDYLDGTLAAAELSAFKAHVPGCPRCAPLLASFSHVLSELHAMQPLEAPPRLVYSILDKSLGPRESLTGWRAIFGWTRGIASIRFAYGALSVAATLIILVTTAGFNWRHPKLADLRPANIYRNADRTAHIVYGRSSKFVNDLRVVNEIQSRLRQENEIPAAPESTSPQPSQQKEPGRTDGSKPTSPRQQNRANDLARHVEVLAAYLPSLNCKLTALWIPRRMP